MATTRQNPEGAGLEFSLRPSLIHLPLRGDRELPINDALLVVRNGTGVAVEGLRAAVTLWQAEAVLAEAEVSLGEEGSALPPGAAVERGFYELLQTLDRGLASRVHLWGPKAVLNWPFAASLAATWSAAGGEGRAAYECAFHWEQPGGPDTEITLAIDRA